MLWVLLQCIAQPTLWSCNKSILRHTSRPGLQDKLRCLAVKQGYLMVGTRYWAKQALTSVLSHIQAASMKLLLRQPDTSYNKPETGALLVVCAHLYVATVQKVPPQHGAARSQLAMGRSVAYLDCHMLRPQVHDKCV